MARYLCVLYLPLLVRLVQSQLLGSSSTCAVRSLSRRMKKDATADGSTFRAIYTCCVRASCDATNAASIGNEAEALCSSFGVAITAYPASACSSTYGVSSTTSASSTQSTFTTTGSVSHDTVTATAIVTQQASGNSNSNSALASATVGILLPIETGSSNPSSSSSHGSGLSTGAKAGIGAGVGGGVLIVLCALLAIMRKNGRRKHKPEQPVPPADVPGTSNPGGDRGSSWVEYKSELDASAQKHKYLWYELDESAQVAKPAAHELPPANPAVTLTKPWNELHADPVYYHQLPTGENAAELPIS